MLGQPSNYQILHLQKVRSSLTLTSVQGISKHLISPVAVDSGGAEDSNNTVKLKNRE
jgi:hypothetical protein